MARQTLQRFGATLMINAQTFRLDGRLALVTGSSSGIGLALARGLAQAGAAVVLNGRDPNKLAQAAALLKSEGLQVHARAFDVTKRTEVDTGIASIEAEIGAIEVLCNNAGMTRRAPFHELSPADWDAVMRTNVDSIFHVGQAVSKFMVARKRGRIINTCSVMSELGRPGVSVYTASKGAVKMLTKAMAIDLGPLGINVNGIGPGYFKTELTEALVNDPTFSAWLVNRTPSRRWGDVEDLAGAAVFLASDASRFVNGHILYVDGGVTASL
jgi:gluconate 5-dehydrogenase